MRTMVEMGRFCANFGLTGIYRIFISFASPITIIKKSNFLWPKYFDSGRIEVKEVDKNTVLLKILDWRDASETMCALLRGYFAKALELSGAKEVEVVPVSCVTQGAPFCEYRVTWR